MTIAFVFVGCQTQHNFHLIGALGCASQKIMKRQKLGAASVHAREEEKETYSLLHILRATPESPNIWHCEWSPRPTLSGCSLIPLYSH